MPNQDAVHRLRYPQTDPAIPSVFEKNPDYQDNPAALARYKHPATPQYSPSPPLASHHMLRSEPLYQTLASYLQSIIDCKTVQKGFKIKQEPESFQHVPKQDSLFLSEFVG